MSYNTFALTKEAVRSALEAADDLSHEVIVIDNNSPDGSANRLVEAFETDSGDRVTIVANTENRGFSAANNQGAALASGSVLYFLNPDTLSHPNSIRILHDFLHSHADAGAVGPRVLNPDGTDQASTSRFVTPVRLLRHHLPIGVLARGKDRREDFVPETTREVDVVKGCALAIKRDVFDEIGGWDERYFMYSEENELCRSLIDAGYKNYFCREALVTHYGGASTSQEDFASQQILHVRSSAEFLNRHYGRGTVLVHRVAGFVGFLGRDLIFRVLARLRPDRAEEYRRRGGAASALWRWFLRHYAE